MKLTGGKGLAGGHEAHRVAQRPRRHGLGQEPRRPGLERLFGDGARGGAGENAHRVAAIDLDGFGQAVEPVHSGHVEIQQDQIERSFLPDQRQRPAQVVGGVYLDAITFEEGRNGVAHQFMIVCYQNMHSVLFLSRRPFGHLLPISLIPRKSME